MIKKMTGADVGVNTTQYGSGDLLGLKLSLGNPDTYNTQRPNLLSVVIQDLTKQKAALDVIIFDSDPTGTTFTNNSALDVDDADLPKIIGVVSVLATDYVDFSDNAVACVTKGIALDSTSGALYACLVCRGTPTYALNELSVAFGFVY
jgi:hypothetical protein